EEDDGRRQQNERGREEKASSQPFCRRRCGWFPPAAAIFCVARRTSLFPVWHTRCQDPQSLMTNAVSRTFGAIMNMFQDTESGRKRESMSWILSSLWRTAASPATMHSP